MKILAAALPLRIKARLVGRMKDAEIQVINTAEELLQALPGGCDLLVLYEGLPGGGLEALRSARRSYSGPVLFCADQTHTAEYMGELQRLRVAAVFQQPFDADELVRRASIELTVKVPTPEPALPKGSGIPTALLAVWKKHEATNQTRVATLFEACELGLTKLSDEEREIAQRAAHQLAGTLGTFGLVQATLLAREAENILRQASEATDVQQTRLAHLAHALELQIADPTVKLPQAEQTGEKGTLLVYSKDQQASDSLFEVASEDGWQVLATSDLTGARKLLALENPAAVILDLCDADTADAVATWLGELAARGSECKLVAIVPGAEMTNLPGCRALMKPVTPSQILGVLEEVEKAALPEGPRLKILAVDDDPIVLESVHAMLQTFPVDITTLADPLAFWDTLQHVRPDLLLLDVDLPMLSGLEICRAVRSDPAYRKLPVLFLSAYSDGDTVHRVFQAGGDDYIYKPVVGPELLTRVANRLERVRALGGAHSEAAAQKVARKDLAIVVSEDSVAVPLISVLVDKGCHVERHRERGEELVHKLTGNVDTRPKVLLLGEEDSLETLQRLDGLGVTATTAVWVMGPFYEEAAVEVFERGGAGFIPDTVSLPRVIRLFERLLSE